MRIAIYSGEIPSTTFIENLINGLAEEGYTILLFGVKKKSVTYSNNIQIHSSPKGKIALLLFVLFNWIYFIIRGKSDTALLKEVMQEKEINTIKKRLYFLSSILPILNNKPDVFHVQWIKGGIEWTFLKRFGIKIVGSFRGAHINYTPIIEPEFVDKYKSAFPHFDHFHSVSKSIANEAQKYGAIKEQISIIPGAVDSSLLDHSIDVKKGKVLKILSIGRFHWKKGYNIALDALKLLKDEGVKFEYSIVGGVGSEEIPFQRRDLGLENEVKFIGRMPHHQILELYKDADLYLLPSVEEGIANVVLEAMALGVPVISTNCGGMAEVIRHKENGWLVPIRNTNAIFESIMDYMEMDSLSIENMIKEARSTINKNHIIPQQIQKFDSLYQSI